MPTFPGYTMTGPFADGTAPALSAAFFNNVENALGAAVYTAAAPSGDTTGATDQAALQPLISSAQSTNGTVILQAGTYYVTGLSTTQSFNQPIIRGQGMRQTTLTVVGTGAAITYVGGSGQPSGGLISDMTINSSAGGGTGVMFAGCNNARTARVWFKTLADGVQFHNRDAGSFTEFCVAENCIFATDVVTPVHYKLTSGNESFHGSGLDECVINQSATATGPVIQIDSGCFPYGAPLTATIFARTTTPLIQNNDSAATRFSEFYGNLDIEALSSPTSVTIVDPGTTNGIFYAGTITQLGTTSYSFGGLQQVTRTSYNGSTVSQRGYLATASPTVSNGSGGTTLWSLNDVSAALVQVQVYATNYYYEFLLHVTRDKYSSAGWVTTLANPRSLNTAGYGAPTFAVASQSLVMTNTSFPASGVTCLTTRTPVAFFNTIG